MKTDNTEQTNTSETLTHSVCVEPVVMWTRYTDTTNHPELVHGKKFCIRDDDGNESYARFHVYEGGEECDFICLHTNKAVRFTEFRELNKEIDLNT